MRGRSAKDTSTNLTDGGYTYNRVSARPRRTSLRSHKAPTAQPSNPVNDSTSTLDRASITKNLRTQITQIENERSCRHQEPVVRTIAVEATASTEKTALARDPRRSKASMSAFESPQSKPDSHESEEEVKDKLTLHAAGPT